METKSYHKDELEIIWEPKKCTHSGVCARTLPNVYHPKDKPWITPENASIEELKNQINKCPSGALSFKINE